MNECLRIQLSGITPVDALNRILAYIGREFSSDRAYVFEFNNNDTMTNTYEWEREGVETQIQNEMVKAAHCDVIQGFYYFRPLELSDLYRAASADHAATSLV